MISSKPNCIISSPDVTGVDSFESVHMFLSRSSSCLGAALSPDMIAT